MLNKNKKFVVYLLAGLVCANVLSWLVVWDLNSQKFLEVNFFDIGQGDAIFIQTPQRIQILIDGGPDSTILEKLSQEMPFYDRTIDLIILTHPEHDHMAGLIEVLKNYKVDSILWTGVLRETAEYKEWQGLIEEEEAEGAKIFIAQSGQEIKIHRCHLWKFEVLYPFENLEGQEPKNINNTSIVARLVFAQNSFLFTGDAFKSVERKLIKQGIELNSNVLKVGHHGSKTSSAEEFIEAVNPEIAIIQCGKNNRYGHPYPETLATLEKYDIKVLRTDQDGDIKIVSDGNHFDIIYNLEHKTKRK